MQIYCRRGRLGRLRRLGPRKGMVVRRADHRVMGGIVTKLAHPSWRKEMDSPAPVRRVAGGAGKQRGPRKQLTCLWAPLQPLPPCAGSQALEAPRPELKRGECLAPCPPPPGEPRWDLLRHLCLHNWRGGGGVGASWGERGTGPASRSATPRWATR